MIPYCGLPWGIMRLIMFHVFIILSCPLLHLAYSYFLIFFNWGIYISLLIYKCLYISSKYESFISYVLKYPDCDWLFHCLIGVFWRTEGLNFIVVEFISLFLYGLCPLCLFRKSCSVTKVLKIFSLFSSTYLKFCLSHFGF